MGVRASAPADHQLKVTWRKPGELHPYINVTLNSTRVNTWSSTHVLNVTYNVMCRSDHAPSLTVTTDQQDFVFTRAHGVKAGTDYTCHVTMTVRAHNGSTLGGGAPGGVLLRTTPKSERASVTTLEGKGWWGFSAVQLNPSSIRVLFSLFPIARY